MGMCTQYDKLQCLCIRRKAKLKLGHNNLLSLKNFHKTCIIAQTIQKDLMWMFSH